MEYYLALEQMASTRMAQGNDLKYIKKSSTEKVGSYRLIRAYKYTFMCILICLNSILRDLVKHINMKGQLF